MMPRTDTPFDYEHEPTHLECKRCGMTVLNDLDAFVMHEERYGHWPQTVDTQYFDGPTSSYKEML